MIGIIVAMEKELKLLMPVIDSVATETSNGFTFYRGKAGTKDIVVMKCGIGKVNAALGTLSMITAFNPSLIINTGVAGGTGNGCGIMDVLVADRIAYSDVWCGPGTEYGEAAGCPLYFKPVQFPFLDTNKNLVSGLICSSDKFIASREEVERIKFHFPDVKGVDMESGAIAQTCHLLGVPFSVVRVISDTPGENDNNIEQYESFWEKAPEATFNIIHEIIVNFYSD